MLLASIIAAIIPAAIYTAGIYWIDRYEKEPLWLLTTTFLWGAIPSIIIALIFNTLLGIPIYVIFGDVTGDALVATFVAPFIEELIKAAVLFLILFFWRHQIDSLLDGIIYGAMVGMGFAMVENVFYFQAVYAEGGVDAWQVNIFMRAVIFGLNHSLYSAMSGLGIAIARLRKTGAMRYIAPIAGVSMAMFLHFVHNGLASFGGNALGELVCIPLLVNAWGGVIITVIIIIWSLWQERQWIAKYLPEEVVAGTITADQLTVVSSGLGRISSNMKALFSGGIGTYRRNHRFLDRCTKLAYIKHHQDWYHDKASLERMETLREEIIKLNKQLNG